MQPLLVYCFDAWCGWCYGFSPVMVKLFEHYKGRLEFEVLSGNMIPAEQAAPVERIASFVLEHYPVVQQHTGIKFGEDFLWHMQNPQLSDWMPASEKSAIALSVFKSMMPGIAILFAADMQYALNYEGRDLNDDEAYRHLLEKYGIDAKLFYEKLHSEAFKEEAYYDFALCRQLKVTGFPAVFVQTAETKFYQVARGFTNFDEMTERIDAVLKAE